MSASSDELLRTLYDELRKLARARINRLRPGQSLQATDLVHEAYLRLNKNPDQDWQGRGHFFGAAARAMRNVLVDQVRQKAALKRGGDHARVDMTVSLIAGDPPVSAEELLALHSALEHLQSDYPDHAEVVLLHCFAGLAMPRVADVTGVSLATAERRWRFARAILQKHMGDE